LVILDAAEPTTVTSAEMMVGWESNGGCSLIASRNFNRLKVEIALLNKKETQKSLL
jgi:hypothetical protein